MQWMCFCGIRKSGKRKGNRMRRLKMMWTCYIWMNILFFRCSWGDKIDSLNAIASEVLLCLSLLSTRAKEFFLEVCVFFYWKKCKLDQNSGSFKRKFTIESFFYLFLLNQLSMPGSLYFFRKTKFFLKFAWR